MSPQALKELQRIIMESDITREDDKNWPAPDRVGRQELEVRRPESPCGISAVSCVGFLKELGRT